jgi:hypothetical protein
MHFIRVPIDQVAHYALEVVPPKMLTALQG